MINVHRFEDLSQSNQHLLDAIFRQICVKLCINRLMLLLLGQMRLEKFNFAHESIGAVQAQLGLTLSIQHRLAEVKQALVLTDILNVLLDEAELVQAHPEII